MPNLEEAARNVIRHIDGWSFSCRELRERPPYNPVELPGWVLADLMESLGIEEWPVRND